MYNPFSTVVYLNNINSNRLFNDDTWTASGGLDLV